MNPDFPPTPREQLEARLTALLLGELPSEEAAALRVQIAQDPELTVLHQRLEHTIGLVREVSVHQSETATAQPEPLKLSAERREKLLTEFKTIKPQPLLPPLPRRQRWLVPVAAAALLLLLAAITLPNFIRARNTSASNAMLNNLRQIEAAKQQWALEHGKSPSDVPAIEDIKDYIKGGLPASVAGETYVLGPVGLPPTLKPAEVQPPRTWFFRQSASTPQQLTRLAKELDPVNERLDEAISSAIQPKPVPPPQLERARGEQLSERYDDAVRYRNLPSQIVLPTPAEPEAEVTASATRDASELGLQFGTWAGSGRPGSVAEGRKAGELVVAQSVSDPEWAGVLERPASPDSTENKFVARHAYVPDRGVSPTTGLPLPAEGIVPEVAVAGQPAAGAVADGFQSRYGLPAAPPQGAERGRLAESVESKVAPLPALAPPPSPRQITVGIAGAAPADPTAESVPAPPGYPTFGELSVARKPVAKPDADKLPVLGDLPALGGALRMERPIAEARSGRVSGPEPVAPVAQPEPQMAAPDSHALDTPGQVRLQDFATAPSPLQPVPRVNVAGGASLPIPSSPTPQVFYSTNVVGYTVVPLESSPVALEAAKQPLRRSQSSIVPPPASGAAGVVNVGAVRAGDPLQDARLLMEAGRSADAEVKLREVLQNEPDNRAAGYYLSLARAQQQAGARKLGEDESRKGVVQTGLMRRELESLRSGLELSEADAAGTTPSPMLEAEALRKVEAARIESATRYLRAQKQLDQLKAYNKEQLMEALPQIVPDAALSEQRVQLGQAEQRLAEAERVYGQEHPEGKRAKAQVDELRRRTDDLTVSVMSELEGRVAAAKGEADEWANVVEEAKELDRERANTSRAYFDKKRELEEAERFRQKPPTNLVRTSRSRQIIASKLNGIRLESLNLNGVTLGEVVQMLNEEAKKRDPEKKGIHFILNPNLSATQAPVNIGSWAVTTGPTLRDVRLADALDAIVKSADQPIKYSLEDYAVVFSQADAAADADLVTRTYKLDPSKFYQGLETVGALVGTLTNSMDELQNGVLNFYMTLGVDLQPAGKAVLWNDRTGTLLVRATPNDLEVIELANQALGATTAVEQDVSPSRKPATNAPIPQPEVQTSENVYSTFSLNVSDVSFKLAAASLEQGQMPDPASVRAEEFINAFDYRDPEPQWDSASGLSPSDSASSLSAQAGKMPAPLAFAWERARYPFAHNRDLLRFSLKTGAAGRQAGRPLNLVLLLDNSGSMERADRVQIIREALRVLAGQLQPQDKLSVITFARTARLVADGFSGDQAGEVLDQVSSLTPQGGTNLEEAMNLAYATALRHYLAHGINRVVLLTDGAANLGNVEPESLKHAVETHRKQGVALDCFGIGWEGLNDDLLEVLSRNGDGRYGFINSPDEAATEFAAQLAGALQVAASDVKVQVEFNPARVTSYRQIGYAKHQLTKEQFRDNTVDAAEIAAREAGNALYTVEVNPAGEGPLCIVRVRFKIPGTTDYREHEWAVPYTGNAVSLEQASPAIRLAASAGAFAEWLVVSPFAAEVTPDALLGYLSGVPEIYGADARPKKLEWMIRQAKSLTGR